MHSFPPNSLRSTVIGCEAKYELTKQRSPGGTFCCEIEAFGQEKGHIRRIICNIMLCKWKFFLKRSFENLFREINFFRPPNSEPSLHPCMHIRICCYD